MTKRFTQKNEDDWEILDRNKHFAYAHSGYQAEKIIRELNELVETNRELYKDNKQLKSRISDYDIALKRLQDLADNEIKKNEQLKEDKEYWKGACSNAENEKSILWNEIHILMEQGAEPSESFKKYLESISTEYDKFWKRKLNKAKIEGVIE